MKYTFLMFLLIGFGCARHHEKSSHHHHSEAASKNEIKFNKLCAESLAEGDSHTNGKEEFKTVHAGHTYYFSSIEKKNKFEANLVENIKKAEMTFEKSR